MKEHPILFSTEMVQAILAGRKTMTRRIVKPAIGWDYSWKVSPIKEEHTDGIPRYEMRCGTQYSTRCFQCPYGQPGDRLWVRETWCWMGDNASSPTDRNRYHYRASAGKNNFTWHPSIHMPRTACRLLLEVKNVRVERLQDITEQDAINEGVESWTEERLKSKPTHYVLYYHEPGDDSMYSSAAVDSFQSLWQSINGPESWEANPWVWVVEFERITDQSVTE